MTSLPTGLRLPGDLPMGLLVVGDSNEVDPVCKA